MSPPPDPRAGPDPRVGFDVLIISNGHGEDAIGAAIAERVRERFSGLTLRAFPLVGTGAAYPSDVVDGPRRALPAGGLTLHHPSLLLEDLRAGIIPLTVRQAVFLVRQRPRAVLVVGDVFAQLLASLVPAPRAVLQPLVSVHQERPVDPTRLNRYFMESIRAPERHLLARAQRVYTRDEATAAALRARGVTTAVYLGNPIMDGLAADPIVPRGADHLGGTEGRRADVRDDLHAVVALLPGSRSYARTSVNVMIEAVDQLAQAPDSPGKVTALVAWTLGERPEPPPGWLKRTVDEPAPGSGRVMAAWSKGSTEVWWVEDGFASVLASADAVIGTSGTANEQAAGLGLPVIAFPVPPFYGSAFLENQERLLGGALRVTTGQPAAVAAALSAALHPGSHRRTAATAGPARLGGPGGTAAVASDLEAWLRSLQQ